jgi:hypothetical protein
MTRQNLYIVRADAMFFFSNISGPGLIESMCVCVCVCV